MRLLLALFVFALGFVTQPGLACDHQQAPPAHHAEQVAHDCCASPGADDDGDCPRSLHCPHAQPSGWAQPALPQLAVTTLPAERGIADGQAVPHRTAPPPLRPPAT